MGVKEIPGGIRVDQYHSLWSFSSLFSSHLHAESLYRHLDTTRYLLKEQENVLMKSMNAFMCDQHQGNGDFLMKFIKHLHRHNLRSFTGPFLHIAR